MATTIFLVNPQTFGGGSSFTNEKSLLFDGVDEYVTYGRPSAMESTDFSLSFWYKPPLGTPASTEPVMTKFVGGASGFYIYHRPTTGDLQVYFFGVNMFSLSGLSNNTWYHIVVTLDSTNGKAFYVDGVSQATSLSTTNGTANTANLYAARVTTLYNNCNIDEVSVFDYALTSGQVTSIYNSGTPTDLDNTSGVTAPVHWWRMGDGDTYPTITDVGTTGGNDGTMTNMESGDIVNDTP